MEVTIQDHIVDAKEAKLDEATDDLVAGVFCLSCFNGSNHTKDQKELVFLEIFVGMMVTAPGTVTRWMEKQLILKILLRFHS